MANEGKITLNDFIEYEGILTQLRAVSKEQRNIITNSDEIAKKMKSSGFIESSKQAKEYKQQMDNLNKTEKEVIRLKEEERLKRNELTKQIRLEVKEQQAVKGSLDQQRVSLQRMIKQYTSGEKTGRKFRGEINKLRKEIEKKEKSIGNATRGVGRYTEGVKRAILQTAGMYLGIRGLITVFKKIVGTIANFEEQMDTVNALIGDSDVSMNKLKKSAKAFGSTTSKTATEVGQLQEELLKLGFSTDEVLKGTGGILALSEATKSDLADAARVAASTIRGFGKDASETTHIVDVMTKSFTKTGLNLQKYEYAMANAQVAAKSTNHTFEKTVAMLGTIIDTGTDASKAGTDLRVILGKLAKQNISLDAAFEKINKSSNKVVAAMKLVGDRAYSSLITLSEQKDKVDELSQAFEDADGTAKAMAKTMKDNLKGDIDRAKSAWEGLVLSIEDGSGGISIAIRSIIQKIASLLTNIRHLNMTTEELVLELTLKTANDQIEDFKKSIEGLTLEEKLGAINNMMNEQNFIIKDQSEMLDDINKKKEKSNKESYLQYEQRLKEDKRHKIELQEFIASAQNRLSLLEQIKNSIEKQIETEDELAKKQEEDFKNNVLRLDEEETLNIDFLDKIHEKNVEFFENKREQEKEHSEYLKKEITKRNKEIFELNKQALEDDKKMTLEKMDLEKRLVDEQINFAYSFFDVQASIHNLESALIDKKYADQILKAEKAGKDTTKIEQERAIEIAKVQQKQAILNKIMNSFEIYVNTQAAIIKTMQELGLPAAIPFMVAARVQGLAAQAAVALEPIPSVPSFSVGTEDAPGGLSIVHPDELIETPEGKVSFTPKIPTLIDLPEHSIVTPREEVKERLAELGMLSAHVEEGITKRDFEKLIDKQTNQLFNNIKRLPKDHYEGLTKTGIEVDNNWTKFIQKYYR